MHVLQSPYWRALKTQFGWSGRGVSLPGCGGETQVLFRRLPPGFNLAYVPKGPDLNWRDEATAARALQTLTRAARQRGTIFLKVEPDCEADPLPAGCFRRAGFEPGRPVQPAATILVDLSPSPEAILAAMKPKTRYNIRLAAKKGVSVRAAEAADVAQFYRLCRITARRDGFAIHSAAYYRAAFNAFPPTNRVLLLAELNGELLAGLMAFAWGGRAYYLYGASSDRHRNAMPAYLLQWQAMQWARSVGCHSYDLWGIPNAPLKTLEANFTHRSDGLWGVYRFKRGFGGRVTRSAGAFDFVYNRPLYRLFVRLSGWGAGQA